MPSLSLLLLSDGRLPAGGYAHSGGLEAAVADGLRVDGVQRFLLDRLECIGLPECMLMVAAARLARTGDVAALVELELEADARCPSPPLRAAARRLGSQLLRTASGLWPELELVGSYRAASRTTPRPVAFGVVAAATGLDDSESAYAYLYDEAMTIASAAIRLIPMDANEALRCVIRAGSRIAIFARVAAETRVPARELPGTFAPLHELRSLVHAGREGRLFAT